MRQGGGSTMSIQDHEPGLLWKHFDEIRKIPRCSGKEERAREYVMGFARDRKWEARADTTGNVVISVPATSGNENAPIVILQGHLDMVCEKNSDVKHDFDKDPIELVIDGEWLTANGTTLGSDNGVGVAASLAVAEDEGAAHGPLELLFTVDEEVGLIGAGKLEPGFLKGSILLNLDSEELDSVFIGCAGGGDSTITFPVKRTGATAGASALTVQVSGLRGGHSGLDIIEQRGNAIKVLGRTLWEARDAFSLEVASFDGGNKRNAIPREAHAVVFVPSGEVEGFRKFVDELARTIALELGGREKGMEITVTSAAEASSQVWDGDSADRLINLIVAIPHGVHTMSYDIPDLVETSNNLASVRTAKDEVVLGTSSRSSIITALQSVRNQIHGVAVLAGATVLEDEPYPGWKPDLDSKLLTVTRDVHEELFGRKPEAKAIHAGLECGIIGEKFPGMDMISFGPRIEHPHSPEERINIPSVERFYTLLTGVLEALSAGQVDS